jgi:hypothetical protein
MTAAFPKILHIGDKPIADLFNDEVEITEKIDGSQFGFGMVDGQLVCRSKGKELDLDNPDKMFLEGVEYVKTISGRLPDNHFFYGEYLQKPRHSTLAYNRTPKNHIALFGVMRPDRTLGQYSEIEAWAEKLEVDAVPLIKLGISDPEEIIEIVKEKESYLGGQHIEGVVVKRYEDWMFLGRILTPVKAGKYVTERFKEVHQADWSRLNTSKGAYDVLKDKYRTEARWHKAIMHLKEKGEFEGTVRDIGNLIKEIQKDLGQEEKENIKQDLWKIYRDDIMRHATKGFVDWYKELIVKGEFQDESN